MRVAIQCAHNAKVSRKAWDNRAGPAMPRTMGRLGAPAWKMDPQATQASLERTWQMTSKCAGTSWSGSETSAPRWRSRPPQALQPQSWPAASWCAGVAPGRSNYRWLLAQRQLVRLGSATIKAINYSLRRLTELTRFVEDAGVPISRSWVENPIRPAAAVMSPPRSARITGPDPTRTSRTRSIGCRPTRSATSLAAHFLTNDSGQWPGIKGGMPGRLHISTCSHGKDLCFSVSLFQGKSERHSPPSRQND